MATHKPFRELLKTGTNFDFIGKQRRWLMISLLLSVACVAALAFNHQVRGEAMNWSIDFRGGTEIVMRFDKKGTDTPIEVGSGDVRKALSDAGHKDVEVSEFAWGEVNPDGSERRVAGMLVRTVEFGAVSAARQQELAGGLATVLKDRELAKPPTWSGDRLFIRSMKPIDWEAANQFFAKNGLQLRPWVPTEAERFAAAEEGTGEYTTQLSIRGIDAQFQEALQAQLDGVEVEVVNVYGVGAKAGEKLRNDGLAALFYAIGLVMVYLAVRFDIRYAPGAVVAMLHDAIMVIGVFAVTWTEVSLTTVAALLTVVGYSVNDTVIIFDRIRENVEKLDGQKLTRIINVSINETLSRSLLTSLTVFVTTVMMNVFSTGLVRNFAFAMNIGVVVGAYSSIFIASPIMLWIHNRYYSGPPRAIVAEGDV